MDVIVLWPLRWAVRRLGVHTVVSLALLLVALASTTLVLTTLMSDLDALFALVTIAVGSLLGWSLAASPLPGWLAGSLAFGLGVEALLATAGGLGRPLIQLLLALARWAWGILWWPLQGPPHVSVPAPASGELEMAAGALWERVRDWALALAGGQAAFDPVATALVWGLLLWLVAAWAGWAVRRRHQPLQGIAPAGALALTALSYAWASPNELYLTVGATLLLMALTRQIARERRWQAVGADFSPELRLDLAFSALALSLALLALAFLAPSISIRPVVDVAHRFAVEHLTGGRQFADSMGLEPRAARGSGLRQAYAPGLPNSTLIGSGPELAEDVVMHVYLEGARATTNPLTGAQAGPRYYWRSVTYDQYTGRGWQTSETQRLRYSAGERVVSNVGLAATGSTSQQIVRQEVQRLSAGGGLLYRAGELVTADQDFTVAWRSPEDAFGAEIEAKTYRVDSSVPVVSEVELRAAGEDYPAWVHERYLNLPDQVPPRVLALARDLTQAAPTPYDRSRAIESYLRTFTYNLNLPAPPPGREIADFFLFSLKQGYCDYYATTMVVLARAAGLPARLVTGYFSGTYEPDAARYVVTAADAHAWVEIYFPAFGWVEFEPTAGRPVIERPAEPLAHGTEAPLAPLEPRETGFFGGSWVAIILGLLGGLAMLSLGRFFWALVDGWRLRRLPPSEAVAVLYQRLHPHGRRLAVPAAPGNTPYEFAAGMTGRITRLGDGRNRTALSSYISRRIDWLTELHVRALYSPHKLGIGERNQAIRTWPGLNRSLWRAWLWQKGKSRDGGG